MRLKSFPFVLALLMNLLVYSAFGQSASEISWLNRQIFPIRTTEPDQKLDDLDSLLIHIRQSRLIGLGECTHGSREIFRMKHRLLQALAEQRDSIIFAMEANFAGAQVVNQYIQTGQGDSLTVLEALGFWTWHTEEVWNLIQWMRNYNQTNTGKLVFSGFDMNVPFPAIRAIWLYAVNQHQDKLKQWTDELDTLYRKTQRTKTWQKRLRQVSHRINDELSKQNASPAIRQSARTLVQCAVLNSRKFQAGNRFRDRCMAANVDWLRLQHPGAGIVLWAHNGHIEKRGGLSRSMGYHLLRTYRSDYLALGFTTGRGTYTAMRIDSAARKRHLSRTNILVTPQPDSFESWFEQAEVPDFYLDLRKSFTNTEGAQWLIQKKKMRNIGSVAGDGAAYQFTPNQRLTKLYDGIFHLNKTTASRCYLAR